MLDLLLAVILFPLIIAVALALLALVTLVPFVLALEMAERRGFSAVRWGAVALAGSLLALAGALLILRSNTVPGLSALLPLILATAGPAGLWLLTGTETTIGGRAGAHE